MPPAATCPSRRRRSTSAWATAPKSTAPKFAGPVAGAKRLRRRKSTSFTAAPSPGRQGEVRKTQAVYRRVAHSPAKRTGPPDHQAKEEAGGPSREGESSGDVPTVLGEGCCDGWGPARPRPGSLADLAEGA